MSEKYGRTIHLDTSFLIRSLEPGSAESAQLANWLKIRHSVAMSALAWGEFLCGPLDEGSRALAHKIVWTHVPLDARLADTAARLFNETGRRRRSFHDCVIAATAIRSRAALATRNVSDFRPFEALGLELAV